MIRLGAHEAGGRRNQYHGSRGHITDSEIDEIVLHDTGCGWSLESGAAINRACTHCATKYALLYR